MLKTVLGIIFFAIATMFVYAWGYVKEQRVYTDLKMELNKKAEKRVINALKRNQYMTKKEISNILVNLKISPLGTRKKVVVQDADSFTKSILDNMVHKGLLDADYKNRPIRYSLKDKNT